MKSRQPQRHRHHPRDPPLGSVGTTSPIRAGLLLGVVLPRPVGPQNTEQTQTPALPPLRAPGLGAGVLGIHRSRGNGRNHPDKQLKVRSDHLDLVVPESP